MKNTVLQFKYFMALVTNKCIKTILAIFSLIISVVFIGLLVIVFPQENYPVLLDFINFELTVNEVTEDPGQFHFFNSKISDTVAKVKAGQKTPMSDEEDNKSASEGTRADKVIVAVLAIVNIIGGIDVFFEVVDLIEEYNKKK